MENSELIEKYLRNELSGDERQEFKRRLATDPSLKELFEVETIIFKSLQYSSELQRLESYSVSEIPEPTVSSQSSYKYSLWHAGIAALAVWIASNVISGGLNVDAGLLKWLGLILAFVTAFASVTIQERKFHFLNIRTAIVNGLLIFTISSGIDAINQGIGSNGNNVKAVLIPFTKAAVWWPTASLVDSLIEQKEVNEELKASLKSTLDSCSKSSSFEIVPIVVPRSTEAVAGAPYEADVYATIPNLLDSAEIMVDGTRISIERDPDTGISTGHIKFQTAIGNFGPGDISKRSYQLQINFPGRKPINSNNKYEVVKPLVKLKNE